MNNLNIDPDLLIAIEPEEFKRAFTLAKQPPPAGDAQGNAESPDEPVGSMQFGPIENVTVAQAMAVLQKEYGNDPVKFTSIVFRIHATIRAVHDSLQSNSILCSMQDSDCVTLHPAILEATAQQPLKADGTFDEQELVQAIQKLRREEYADG